MKKIIVSVIFFLLLVSEIHADKFQLVFREGEATSYNISYSSIKIFDANNNILFSGVTDKYGRITVNVNRTGIFKCVVSYRGSEYQKQLTLRNSNDQLIMVTFP
jgi:hypothetical protein